MKQQNFKKKSRRWQRWIFLFLFIIVCGVIIFLLFFFIFKTNFLKVNRIELEGGKTTDRDQIIKRLTKDISSYSYVLNFLGEKNLVFWLWGKNAVFHNFSYPGYKIDLEIDIFNKIIKVIADEKVLFGVFCSKFHCYGFDNNGVVISEVPETDGFLILKIDDPTILSVSLGSYFLEKKEWIKNIFETIEIIQSANLDIESITIQNHNLHEWSVFLREKPKIYFSLDFIPDNLENVLLNQSELNINDLEYIDFRVANRLYYQ